MPNAEPEAGNRTYDWPEDPPVASRMSRAVARWNAENDGNATYTIYVNKEDAVPPIDCHDAEPGEVYTRLSYPAGALTALQEIELELSYEDTPHGFDQH